ncbi:MAG: plasmid mobilization protein [Bacillota bacterium]
MKDIRIAVRVTAKEKEKIRSKARKCGLSPQQNM